MFFCSNEFQLKHIFGLINETYIVYGPSKKGKVTTYSEISSPSQIHWGYKRSVMSFKKIFYPNGREILAKPNKIAVMGMPACDIAALHIFLKQFSKSGLLPDRDDILIIGSDCQPDDHCFCGQYNLSDKLDYDLFVVEDRPGSYIIESKNWRGKELVEKAGLKSSDKKFNHESKSYTDKIDLRLASKNIENKNLTNDFWGKIANNCFGCGACSSVCPLCYCFRQDYRSTPGEADIRCLNWDSCFAGDFAKIQFGHDMRPDNKDRLYNWYHHKFIRGPREIDEILCVGCGRCITACPANLSIYNILHTLNKKYPADQNKDKLEK